ncbi:MAG: glycosyl hydrolase family 18 protein [Eubacteriales bacterium]|nr:glycosyl hydrolase family 18 protein [Eubacteriales bacterium]
MNDGVSSIFDALRYNTTAQDTFISEIIRIIDEHPWAAGVDIDLEMGGGLEHRAASNALFSRIYNTVKAKGKLMNVCLPAMSSMGGSVGGENWCVYPDIDNYCDTAAIMSYGMAWAGSAPGPVSPKSWLDEVYDYAATAMTPSKVFLGMPGYGWRWQIDHTPAPGEYRGTSQTYYGALYWLDGIYNHTGDAPPQPFIPFAAYWDDVNKTPWAMLHVYDYLEAWDYISSQNLVRDQYGAAKYATMYTKDQVVEFDGIVVDRDAYPDVVNEGAVWGYEYSYLTDPQSSLSYNFSVPASGTYDIVAQINFPWFNKNAIGFKLDGGTVQVESESRLWWPYWRRNTWIKIRAGISLSAGSHTLTLTGGVSGAMFCGFRVCSSFTQAPSVGEATYTLSPRHFVDKEGNQASPAGGFVLTVETLRRDPDSALAFYDDFRDTAVINTNFYSIVSGSWAIWRPETELSRPYSQLEGSGDFALAGGGYGDVNLRARFAFVGGAGGKTGIYRGDVSLVLNHATQALELYQGSTLKGSFAMDINITPDDQIRTAPLQHTIEMRIRGSSVRVYSGSARTLRFQATITPGTGGIGIRSERHCKCDLLRLGDAWYYEPSERLEITLPDSTTLDVGRISRTGVTWDSEFQMFRVDSDIEESETRTESISAEFDFMHSNELNLVCGGDYTVTVKAHDINIWLGRLFLGDADGFSLLYYTDVDSLVYFANQAAYRWGLRGLAIWSLGQEDLRIWEALPRLA